MVLNHVVILTFSRILDDNEQHAMTRASHGMTDRIPGIRTLECGFDLGLADKSVSSFCLSVKFSSTDDYLTYASHAVHVDFVNTYVKPVLAAGGRKAIQYETA